MNQNMSNKKRKLSTLTDSDYSQSEQTPRRTKKQRTEDPIRKEGHHSQSECWIHKLERQEQQQQEEDPRIGSTLCAAPQGLGLVIFSF